MLVETRSENGKSIVMSVIQQMIRDISYQFYRVTMEIAGELLLANRQPFGREQIIYWHQYFLPVLFRRSNGHLAKNHTNVTGFAIGIISI